MRRPWQTRGDLSLDEAERMLPFGKQMIARYQRQGRLSDPLTYESIQAFLEQRRAEEERKSAIVRPERAAELLKVSKYTIRDWQQRGWLPRELTLEAITGFQRPEVKRKGSPPRGELSLAEAGRMLGGISRQAVRQRQDVGTLPDPLTRAAVEALARDLGYLEA